MQANNLLLIMSDQHDPRYMGGSGHSVVETPALDRLAVRGTRFINAYTPSPICVPARASFATGRYVHDIGYWDNAMGYEGRVRSWGHRLQEVGNRVDAIGKLHYRRREDPLGFDHQMNTMHLYDGIGQVWGSIRDPLPEGPAARMFHKIGPNDSSYAPILKMIEQELRHYFDPETVDAQAKADQAELIRQFGGRDKALRTGTKGATPIPGQGSE